MRKLEFKTTHHHGLPTRSRVVREVLRGSDDDARPGEAGITLHEISKRLGLAPSTIHRHLKELVTEGVLDRTAEGSGNRVGYLPRAHLRVEWLDPRRRVFLQWATPGEVDWRFPLVSRVPDAEAQEPLLRFLHVADERGYLAPFPPGPPRLPDPRGRDPLDDVREARRTNEGLTFVVYGSSARGEARRSSDIDLLIITPAEIEENRPFTAYARLFGELAGEANLWSRRRLDVRTVPRDRFSDALSEDLQESIMRDGVTIFTTFPRGEFAEAPTPKHSMPRGRAGT